MYLNGKILPAERAAISPFDVGLLRGFGVFDLLQTIDGRPVMLRPHLERFRASAALIGLDVPVSDDELSAAIDELLARNGHAEATVRLVLTGGVSPDGMSFDRNAPTLLILTHEMFAVPERYYTEGAKLVTLEHRREIPEAKTTNYVTWLRMHDAIDAAGAIDVLYHDGGLISEAATASFYIVREGRIHAPDSGVLPGTVGTLVLERARARYEVVFGPITLADALAADEAFITSSVREVVPIVRIDDRVIGGGVVGPVVTQLMRICREAMREAPDPCDPRAPRLGGYKAQ